MRIVTWNTGCGPRSSRYVRAHDEAWAYLLDELKPDVALVQEALVAKIKACETHHVTLCNLASDDVGAGTAVLVRGLAVSPATELIVSPQTYAVPVELTTPAGGKLIVVAAHVYPGKTQHADLAKFVERVSTTYGDKPVLVGGDFNSARRFDEVYKGKKHRAFFDAMEAAGLHDVHFGLHGREIQSFWGHQAKEPYQDDHFFLSKAWASRVMSCQVIDNDTVRVLSDHGPVVLELEMHQIEALA